MRITAVAVLLFTSASLFAADRVEPLFVPEPIGMQQRAAAPRVAQAIAAEPVVTLASADEVEPESVDALRQWNAEGRTPAKNGFTRNIGGALPVRIGGGTDGVATQSARIGRVTKTAAGNLLWSGSVRVERAYRFRVHLRNVVVPAGTTFWVYGTQGEATAFGTELIDENRDLYVPSIAGEVAYLEVEVPNGHQATFEVADVLELFAAAPGGVQAQDSPTCLVDMKCVGSNTFDIIEQAGRAVAHLQYVKSGDGYVCSGGLLNDSDTSTSIPYLLTANHCFSSQSSATSLEAYWDYRTNSCGGAFPNLNGVTRTVGSTLLATNTGSDFTFVRMNSIPGSRILLGWDSRPSAVPAGTTLYRLSHPFPDAYTVPAPQFYSSSVVNTSSQTCSARPRPNYLYSVGVQGGTYGGSSGSPVMLAGGYVVGQLFGACGPNPTAGCDNSNYTVDGALSATYPSIVSYLNPNPSGNTCTPSSTTACMLNNRFKVTVKYRPSFDTNPPDTAASVKSVTGFANPSFESAFFYFNSDSNIEMLVKLLDQGNTNNQGQPTIAVLFATATPLGIEVTITDTTNNATKTYRSDFGKMAGGTDFTAFVK
jgi:hypothetical protein